MKREDRYKIIRPLFLQRRIKSFRDLFEHVPPTVFAGSLGKITKRFIQLIEDADKFKVEEIVQMARLCKLSMFEMFGLLQRELTRQYRGKSFPRSQDDHVKTMYRDGDIVSFSDIFKHSDVKPTAEGAKVNRTRLAKSKTVIKKMSFEILLRVGLYHHLSIADTLKLIEAEYIKQNQLSGSRL